jgi:hypothetical protein
MIPGILESSENPFSWTSEELIRWILEETTEVGNEDKEYFEVVPEDHPHGIQVYVKITGREYGRHREEIPFLWEDYRLEISLKEDEKTVYKVERLSPRETPGAFEKVIEEWVTERLEQPHSGDPQQREHRLKDLSKKYDPKLTGHPNPYPS